MSTSNTVEELLNYRDELKKHIKVNNKLILILFIYIGRWQNNSNIIPNKRIRNNFKRDKSN